MVEKELRKIILDKYKSVKECALAANIPYTTLDSILKRGVDKANILNIIKLCRVLDIDTDALAAGVIQPRNEYVQPALSASEHMHIKKYRDLDSHGKKVVNVVLDTEHERCTAPELSQEDEEDQNIIELDFPYQAASAGAGDFADDTAHEKLAVRLNENTRRADYLMRVNGDSMEPKYQDGDILLVHSQPSVEEGEVGIFIINGDRLVKQQGAGELISLNPQYPNIPISETDSVYCKGKVIGVLSPEDML